MATEDVVLVGRDRELERLRTAYLAAAGGGSRLVTLSGEAGIGKTTLAEALTRDVWELHGSAAWGRCWETGGAPAYSPWVQALRGYARGLEEGDLGRLLGSGGEYVVRLVPEIGASLAQAPAVTPASESEEARFALFDAVATFLRRASEQRPLLLVFDDLHASDASSLRMLRFVARELGDARVLIVGTYRDVEARLDPSVTELITDLNREGERIFLPRLEREDVGRLVAGRAGAPPAEPLVASLHDITAGNPFFVSELVRLLEAEGRLPDGVDESTVPIPEGVREMIGRRLDHAGTETRDVLLAGAVVGRGFSFELIEEVCGGSELAVLDPLDSAVELGILREEAGAPGQYRFHHGLVRDALYAELDVARRTDLHRRVAEALERVLGGDREPHLAELAHHYFAAGEPRQAIEYAAAAGDRASRLLAHEDAAWHYRRALDTLESAGLVDDERRCDLLLALGEAEWRAGEPAVAKERFLAAGAVAGTLDSPDRLARAALGFGGRFGWVEAIGDVDPPLVELLERALAAQPPGDAGVTARLMARLSMQLYFSPPDRSRRERLIGDAIEMARRTGDKGALAEALNARRYLLWHSAGIDERLATATELVAVADAAGETELSLRGHSWRIIDLLEAGDLASAEAAAERHARLAEELRQPLFLSEAVKWRGLRALRESRFDDAERSIAEFAGLAQNVPDPLPAQTAAVQLYGLRFQQGRLGELVPALHATADRYPGLAAWRSGLAFAYSETGQFEEARAEAERVVASGFFDTEPVASWAVAAGMLAEIYDRLGDDRHTARLYEMLLPYARLCIVIGYAASMSGAAGRALGKLAMKLGRYDNAERHFTTALELDERMRSPFYLTWTRIDFARMLLARRAPGDGERARRLVAEAAATARMLDVSPLAWRVAEVEGARL